MSVLPSDCTFYGSANSPDTDGSTTGGAVSFATKMVFDDLGSNDTVDYLSSSGSDTATTITTSGRNTSGTIVTETKTLNGTTLVSGAVTFQRLMKAVQGGTTAVGDIAVLQHTAVIASHTMQSGSANASGITPALAKLQSGDGVNALVGMIIRVISGTGAGQLRQVIDNSSYGTDFVAVNRNWSVVPDNTSVYSVYNGMLFDLSPNQVTQVRRPFYNVAADVAGGSTRWFFEKVFAVNNNTATALTVASLSKQADPSTGYLNFALCSSLNDTGTVTNRQTAPITGLASLANTTLNGAIASTGATSMTVTANASFPQSITQGGFYVQIDNEIVQVTAGAGTNTWTIVRGVMGSTAATHSNGAAVNQYFTNGASPQSENVPSPQNLPNGAAPNSAGAQAMWLNLMLLAGAAPGQTSFTLRAAGQTT